MKLTSYSAIDIGRILGNVTHIKNPEACISHLLIDSRKVHHKGNTLFVALVGDFRDGHQFIEELYQQGVRNFLVSKQIGGCKEANFFQVEDTLKALQDLAIAQRAKAPIPVIGITGSNGKTIVKEWLFQLLQKDLKIVRNPKSYNSQIGVALSVWQIHKNYDLGIFEAGISHPGEMERLQEIIQPEMGVFTNIGSAHQENFESLNQKIREKLNLFKGVRYLIYNGDAQAISDEVESCMDRSSLLIWGKGENADLRIREQSYHSGCTTVIGIYRSKEVRVTIPFEDDASVENAMHCWMYLLHQNYSQSEIQNRFNALEPIEMRLEQKEGVDGSVILNDAYNSDPKALEIALDYLGRLQKRKKTVILSDILQSGENAESLYKKINSSLSNHSIYQFIGIGEELFRHQDLIEIRNKHFFLNTQSFIDQIHAFDFFHQGVLIKGARKFEFEKITSRLIQKTHQTQLEINLDALRHNLRFYRNRLGSGVKIMVMVKAYGYGAGGPEVARLLASEGVDYLGVAYADEGVAIRKAGIGIPIMVMNPSIEAFATMINYNLEPEIYSVDAFKSFVRVLNSEGVLSSNYKIHLKVDTGMNRLGFRPEDLDLFLRILKRERYIKVASVFSHLAASDMPEHDVFTKEQIQKFEFAVKKIEDQLGYDFIKHISNSAAIERFDAQFDMVRLGLGLYGVAVSEKNQSHLKTVSALNSIIVQVKHVKKGESIGYSRNFMASDDMKIAIIPIGYADGVNRKLGNGVGHVFINGERCPIVGNICMDLIMVDVSNISAQVNDRVEIFGENIRVQEIASKLETISYEVLSSIPPRVKRVYIKEDS
ncbi:bifunctional UDP-N-acetylmuramoyl-tripeptide:D-alanyl-D-alanine ligase/alanine racemase [bacterium SCSIO 12643]|nr:bifunctional UDP-N-acetylmuramoyl-tripeptide:D-alanyl-D-alanine ligase/alanine racemase [bacterium SCSIO 12643]